MNFLIRCLLLTLFLLTTLVAYADDSMLRVTCSGDDVGAAVTINGKFKGECPVDMKMQEGTYKLRVEKNDATYDRIFEQDIRMGDGVVKKVEAVLSKRLNAAAQKHEEERTRQQAAAAQIVIDSIKMVQIPGRSYEVGKYEVTQGQWKAVMGSNPSIFSRCSDNSSNCSDSYPMEGVSWGNIQAFIAKLNAKAGKQYRLPTEAEWEYACYGGSQTEYCGGNDLNAVGWYDDNSGKVSHPVGQKQANGYGLYDMTGNVWERVSDCWEGNCDERVIRGGSWASIQDRRSWVSPSASNRQHQNSTYSTYVGWPGDQGFRLVRTLP